MHLETQQVPSGICYGKFTERDGEGRKVPSYRWMNGWRQCIDFMSENANCRLGGISTQYGPWVKWQKGISGYLTIRGNAIVPKQMLQRELEQKDCSLEEEDACQSACCRTRYLLNKKDRLKEPSGDISHLSINRIEIKLGLKENNRN